MSSLMHCFAAIAGSIRGEKILQGPPLMDSEIRF